MTIPLLTFQFLVCFQVLLWKPALFLFSSIHESLSYLEGRATVFHSCYLSVCADTGTTEMPSVVLGHFVLPPACLQEGQAKKLIWGYFPREIPHECSLGAN